MSYRTPKGFKARFKVAGIKLILVREMHQHYAIGIHRSSPNARELEDALEQAERDMFPAVYIHDQVTIERLYEYRRSINQRRRALHVVAGNDWALQSTPRGELRLVGGAA